MQTQCPTCQSLYPIPTEQIGNVSAKARCPKCKTTFLINDNRIGQAPSEVEQAFQDIDLFNNSGGGVDNNISGSNISGNNGSSSVGSNSNNNEPSAVDSSATLNQQSLEATSQNPSQQPPNQAEDGLGSLDDMSSWLEEQASSISQEKMNQEASVVDIEKQRAQKEVSQTTEQATLSSKHIEARVHEGENEEWLDQILTQDVSSTSSNDAESDNDLNDLLSGYGVNVENAEKKQSIYKDGGDPLKKTLDRVIGEKPTQQQLAKKKPLSIFLVWSLGCFFLVALLVAQYLIFNVNTLVKNPEHRASLTSVCKLLSCRLPSADLSTLGISHVKHRASLVNDAKKNADIIGALVNISERDQLYPNLKVTIQGSQGVLGEFVAAPKDYLITEQDQIGAEQAKLFMFTVPLNNEQITEVKITPFY